MFTVEDRRCIAAVLWQCLMDFPAYADGEQAIVMTVCHLWGGMNVPQGS